MYLNVASIWSHDFDGTWSQKSWCSVIWVIWNTHRYCKTRVLQNIFWHTRRFLESWWRLGDPPFSEPPRTVAKPWPSHPAMRRRPMTSWKPPICLRWLHPVNWWNPPVLEICLRSFGASAAMYCTVFRSVVFLVGIRRGEKHWKTDQTKRHGHLEECESVCINIQCISMYFPHW